MEVLKKTLRRVGSDRYVDDTMSLNDFKQACSAATEALKSHAELNIGAVQLEQDHKK